MCIQSSFGDFVRDQRAYSQIGLNANLSIIHKNE